MKVDYIEALAICIIYFLFFGGIGLAVYKGIPAMIKQLKDLSESVPQIANQYMGFIDTDSEKDGNMARWNSRKSK